MDPNQCLADLIKLAWDHDPGWEDRLFDLCYWVGRKGIIPDPEAVRELVNGG